jgi:hypothetical protein
MVTDVHPAWSVIGHQHRLGSHAATVDAYPPVGPLLSRR